MSGRNFIFSDNSFDVISLVAALWVMFSHTVAWIFYNGDGGAFVLSRISNPGPAVSIFFFVSGFLCAASYGRSKSIKEFYWKRLLRIYPALLVVLLLPVLIWGCMGCWGGNMCIHIIRSFFLLNAGWVPCDTFENGSLWTIPIQLQFYIITPILMFLLAKRKVFVDISLWFLCVVFCVYDDAITGIIPLQLQSIYERLCLPYLYVYLGGLLCYKYFDRIVPIVVMSLPYLTFLFILLVWVLNIAPVFCRSIMISLIALGVGYKYGSHRLRYDISYGVYLWHLPIASLLLYIDDSNPLFVLISCWVISLFAGYFSFKHIEKPICKNLGHRIHFIG